MRWVTLNTWKGDGAYRRRLQHMAQGLRALNPDVVLLQEVLATPDGSADTAQHLAHALGLHAVVVPARCKRRTIDGVERISTSGMAVLLRQPPLQAVALPLPSHPADGERLAQLVQMAPQAPSGRPVWVANVHLTHLPQAQGLRGQQLAAVWQALQRHAAKAACVVGGDFNAPWPGPHAASHWAVGVPLRSPEGSMGKTTHVGADGVPHDLDHLLLCPHWPTGTEGRTHVALMPWATPPERVASDHAAVVLDLP